MPTTIPPEQPEAPGTEELLQAAWQGQKPAILSPLTARLIERSVKVYRWKNRLNDTIAIAVLGAQVVFFSAAAAFGEVLLCRIGCGLFAAAAANAVHSIAGHGWVRSLGPARAAGECLDFYRAELQRRRDWSAGVLSWGIWPFVPGTVLGLAGWLVDSPGQWPVIAGVAIFWGFMQYILWAHSREDAARLEREVRLLGRA